MIYLAIFIVNLVALAMLIGAWWLSRRFLIRWICMWIVIKHPKANIPDLLTLAREQRLITEKDKSRLLQEFERIDGHA